MKKPVVLITGASSGIGRASAIEFAKKGFSLAITSHSAERLDGTYKLLEKYSRDILKIEADITDISQVKTLFDEVEKHFGYLNILINCAGAALLGNIEDIKQEKLEHIFKLNFFSVLWCMQHALPLMQKAEGKKQIINISSIAGKRGIPSMGAYCASKFAVNGLTEAARLEFKKKNIDMLLVCPGGTETGFYSNAVRCPSEKNFPEMGRMMSAEYVAREISRASDKNKREIVVGTKGKMLVFINRLSGRLTDIILSKVLK